MVKETAKKPRSTEARHCPVCDAPLRLGDTRCWLCGAIEERRESLGEPRTIPYASAEEKAPAVADNEVILDAPSAIVGAWQRHPIEHVGGFSLASLMMFVTLLCVVLGVSTIAPGVGIPLGIVLLVVWLRTVAVARRRATLGAPISRVERVQLFFASFGVTLALIALLCVAGCAAFVAACFACAATIDAGGLIPGIVFAVVAAAVLFPFLLWIIRIIRRRWRRDIGDNSARGGNLFRDYIIVICIVIAIALLWWLMVMFRRW